MALADEICRIDAFSLAAAIRAKQLSPVEVVEAVLDRMTRLDSELHAFCTPTPELALADAKRIEAEIIAGRDAGVLGGVPVSIKDLIFTKGVRTTSGSVVFRDFIHLAVDSEVRRIVREAARVFERDLGCIVERAHPGWDDPAATFAAIMIAETDLRGMRELIATHGAQMSQHMVELMARPMDGGGFHQRQHRAQIDRQQDVALHG